MFIHTKYCSDIGELRDFLKKLSPDELITVTQGTGYAVVWKSNKQYDFR